MRHPWLPALLLLTLASCTVVLNTDRHQGGEAPLDPVDASDFCLEFSTVTCEGRRDCCVEPGFNLDACISVGAELCAQEFGEIALRPDADYDPNIGAEVIAEARAFAETCDPDIERWGQDLDGLLRVFSGRLDAGATCTEGSFFDCADSALCLPNDQDEYVCVPRLTDGEECFADFQCMNGSRCTNATSTVAGVCAEQLPPGSACSRDTECTTFRCDDDTCVAATVGQAYCDEQAEYTPTEACGELARLFCEARSSCCGMPDIDVDECLDAETSNCTALFESFATNPVNGYNPVAAVEVLEDAQTFTQACDPTGRAWLISLDGVPRVFDGTIATGAACLAAVDEAFACMDEGICIPAGGGSGRVCAPRVGPGGGCSRDAECVAEYRCSAGLQGMQGICEPLKLAGATCNRASECASAQCTFFTCTDPTVEAVYCQAL